MEHVYSTRFNLYWYMTGNVTDPIAEIKIIWEYNMQLQYQCINDIHLHILSVLTTGLDNYIVLVGGSVPKKGGKTSRCSHQDSIYKVPGPKGRIPVGREGVYIISWPGL